MPILVDTAISRLLRLLNWLSLQCSGLAARDALGGTAEMSSLRRSEKSYQTGLYSAYRFAMSSTANLSPVWLSQTLVSHSTHFEPLNGSLSAASSFSPKTLLKLQQVDLTRWTSPS